MSPEQNELRVELKRYLCGVPFSHVRDITAEERKALVREILPYMAMATAGIIPVVWLLAVAVQAEEGRSAIFVVALASFLACIPAYCLRWAWPHLQSLRSGKVSTYIGRMNDLAAFDAALEYFQADHSVDEHFDRYVEVLATGKGDRLWRLEGVSNKGALRRVRPIDLALMPDRHERGARPLSPEEREELRLRSRDFKKSGDFLISSLFSFPFAAAIVNLGRGLVPALSVPLALIVFIGVAIALWTPYAKRRKFARILQKDERAGTVRDGFLASGLPWVVNGEPALWRLGRALGGTNAVSTEQAMGLEIERSGDCDVEESDADAELVRQALAAGKGGVPHAVEEVSGSSPDERRFRSGM